MNKPVLYIRDKKEDEYIVLIDAIPEWEGFERLVEFLEMNYQARVLKSYDGPDARRWFIVIQDETIELIHDDGYGNFFRASTSDGDKLIELIGKDLEKRLKADVIR